MPIFPNNLKNITMPKLVPVEQSFDDSHIEKIEEAVSQEILKDEILKKIRKGQRIAVAVGSRGIANIDRIAKAVIDTLQSLGAEPFLVSAMGSHGGGTVEGQLEILESYGITEQAMGVPILAEQEVVRVGTTKTGVPVVIDKNANDADMIIVINRIKCHTDFSGPIESGLCKMLAIGLGKHEGCSRYHNEGFEAFPELLPEIASIIIENAKVGFGLAIIENAYGDTFEIKAVEACHIVVREQELLSLAKKLTPYIMIPEIDLLIVEEIGKDISGGGMDPKVTGVLGYNDRWRLPGFEGPYIRRIFLLGLSKATHGNANGIGLADFALKSILEQIDFVSTYANAIAAKAIDGVKIPLLVDSYEEGLTAAFSMTGYEEISRMKIVKIKNTSKLDAIEVSENLVPLVMKNKKMKLTDGYITVRPL